MATSAAGEPLSHRRNLFPYWTEMYNCMKAIIVSQD
jgi:hypothetical protein